MMAETTSSKKTTTAPKTTKAASAVAAGKVAAVKKPATKPKAAPKVSATTPKRASPAKKKAPVVSVEQRSHYIEVAAYFIAERRGFTPGDTLEDWIAAEAQVDQLLSDGKLGG